jgi:hypothetical protein
MKKIVLVVVLFAGMVSVTFAQPVRKPIGFGVWLDCFKNKDIPSRYSTDFRISFIYHDYIEDDLYEALAPLDNDSWSIDTGLEYLLALYFSERVRAIQPPQAEVIMPHGRASEVKIAVATAIDLAVVKYLDPQNERRLGNYKYTLKFLTDENKISENELNNEITKTINNEVDANARKKERAVPDERIKEIKQMIVNFFLNPSTETYNVLARAIGRYNDRDRAVLRDTIGSLNVYLVNKLLFG